MTFPQQRARSIGAALIASLLLICNPACHTIRLKTFDPQEKEKIEIYDIQQMWDDTTLFTMWVKYDPVAPPTTEEILASVQHKCDELCHNEGYYGYVIEECGDYDLEKGMQVGVRFFGFKRDMMRYTREKKQ